MNFIHFKRFIQFTSLFLLCFGLNRQQATTSNGMQTGLSCNITINGTCYIYVSTRMNWSDAEYNCISMGGHLTSIHSDAENTAVSSIRPRFANPFIGCNDILTEGNFLWTDDSDFSYTNWEQDPPNNQDCCNFWYNTDNWNVRGCHKMLHSICKVTGYESTPNNTQPTTTTTIPTTQATTSTTTPTQPTTSTTTPPTTSTTTQPTTSITTQPTTSTTNLSTISTTNLSTTSTTNLSTTSTTNLSAYNITNLSTPATTSMATSNITTIPITEEPLVNVSEVRDSLLNIIEALNQPEKLFTAAMINNVLQVANTLIEYSTQQVSQNQSVFIDDVILIVRLIDLFRQQVYNIIQNSSDDIFRFEMNSIKLQINLASKQDLISNHSTNIDISFQTTSSDNGIETSDTAVIPTTLLLPLITSDDSRIIITSYWIQVNISEEEPLRLNQIASNIIGLSITGIEPGENLKQPIQFKFQAKTIINNPLCSFLMENLSYWSQSGLEYVQTSPNMTVCETSHLTSFAVLAGSKTQYSPTENLILHILSYVLLSISLIFLFVALGAFFYSSRLVFRLEANIMYFNYGLTLTLAIFTFILGAELHRFKSPIPCIFISFFIHYIWLVVFASSTALSALIFYATWLSGIEIERRFIAPYLIVAAWSIPLLITVAMCVPMLINEKDINGHPSFLTKNSCILSSVDENRVLNWYTIPFYALIFIMIIVNAVILILTLFKIYKVLKKQPKSKSTQNHYLTIFRTMAISALILLPILGVPWIITPIIAYTPNVDFLSTFLDWIFILLNCPVGIAFFVITIKIEEIKLPFFKAKPPTSNTLPISSASKPINKRRFVAAKPATFNSTTLATITNSTTISTTTTISISNEVNLNTEIYESSVSSSALVNIINNPTTIYVNLNTDAI